MKQLCYREWVWVRDPIDLGKSTRGGGRGRKGSGLNRGRKVTSRNPIRDKVRGKGITKRQYGKKSLKE